MGLRQGRHVPCLRRQASRGVRIAPQGAARGTGRLGLDPCLRRGDIVTSLLHSDAIGPTLIAYLAQITYVWVCFSKRPRTSGLRLQGSWSRGRGPSMDSDCLYCLSLLSLGLFFIFDFGVRCGLVAYSCLCCPGCLSLALFYIFCGSRCRLAAGGWRGGLSDLECRPDHRPEVR